MLAAPGRKIVFRTLMNQEQTQVANLRFLITEKEVFHRHWLATMLEMLGA